VREAPATTQPLISLSIYTRLWSKVTMQKRYVVNLTDQERTGLEGVVRGRGAIGKRQRAQILLKADEGLTDAEIAEENSGIISKPRKTSTQRSKLGWMPAGESAWLDASHESGSRTEPRRHGPASADDYAAWSTDASE
jgi:hypothetical protein